MNVDYSMTDFFLHQHQVNLGLDVDARTRLKMKQESVEEWRFDMTESGRGPDAVSVREVMGKPDEVIQGVRVYQIFPSNFTLMMKVLLANMFGEIVVDFITDETTSYRGRSIFLVIGLEDVAFAIRVSTCLKEIRQHICPILEDSRKVKLLFASKKCAYYLRKDFLSVIVGGCDLMEVLSRSFGHDSARNKHLLAFGEEDMHYSSLADYRLLWTDWTKQLSREMLAFIAATVSYSFQLWDYVKNRKEPLPDLTDAVNATKQAFIKPFRQMAHPPHPCSEEDWNSTLLKEDTVYIKPTTRLKFDNLHEWRDRFARLCDRRPCTIASNFSLLKLANLKENKIIDNDVLAHLGFSQTIISKGQAPTLRKLVRGNGNSILKRMNEKVCHNCITTGHIAFLCPLPENPNRHDEYAGVVEEEYAEKAEKYRLRRGGR